MTWAITAGGGAFNTTQTTTGTDSSPTAPLCNRAGVSCNYYLEGPPAGLGGGLSYIVSTITASLPNGNGVTFNLTQSPNPTIGTLQQALPVLISPSTGTVFTGTAGGTSSTPIVLNVATQAGLPLQNVSVRLIPGQDLPAGGPSVSCVTGPGADPGSVLTDASGNATCTPQFGVVSSKGQTVGPFYVLVGGVASVQNQGLTDAFGQPYFGRPAGYWQNGPFSIQVNLATPAGLTVVSGNNQFGNRSQDLPQRLVVKVVDSSGNPLAGQQVSWSVSPSAYASVQPSTSTSDTSGQASAVVTLSPSAVGTFQVRAITTNGFSATFNVSVNVQLTGLSKVSGDNQSATTFTNFGQALVVQVGTAAGQSPAGVPVQFTTSGVPVTLSAGTATSDSSGRAQIAVQAGGTPGTATVTASVLGFSTSFTLTIIPPGPNISGASFLNGAGFFPSSGNNQTALSPCGIGTLVNGGTLSPLPATPNMIAFPAQTFPGTSITFAAPGVAATPAPILNVSGSSPQLITFQVPCELPANSYTITVTVNGGSKDVPFVPVRPGAPGIFETVLSDGKRAAIIVRPDGSFASLQNPARRGETVRMYITGGGPTQPAVASNALPTPGVDVLPADPNQIIVGVNNAGVGPVNARLAPDLIGVWEVSFPVPTDAPTGEVLLSVGVHALDPNTQYSQGTIIPIQ